MTQFTLRGVIAATITPVSSTGDPDLARLISHVRFLLDNGCDAINLLGTTGEATSFGIATRMSVMRAIAESGLPLQRFMVGTGTSALEDTIALTRLAGELGFAGALVLPPFYYKPVSNDGMVDYFAQIFKGTSACPIPLYLYNFPALSGVTYTVELVNQLVDASGTRIAGLKDSSGDLDYAAKIAGVSTSLAVFPSNEAVLVRAKAGEFAGCISATANLNSRYCADAYHRGDEVALSKASAIRGIFDGVALVPAIKAMVAHVHGDVALGAVLPPLERTSDEHVKILTAKLTAAAQ